MAHFNFHLDNELLKTAREKMSALGLKSLAGFIRMAIIQFPFYSAERRWSDEQMKNFARQFAERAPSAPGILESIEVQLNKAFDQFKTNG